MSKTLTIKRSPIAGRGVFANHNFKKGQLIYVLGGEAMNTEEMIRRVDAGQEEGSDPLGIGNDLYLDLDEFSRTFNHACDPNAFLRGVSELVALRTIRKGEEITFDYSTAMNDNKRKITQLGYELWTHPCDCGSRQCRGIIDQFKNLPPKRRQFYLSRGLAPDFILRAYKRGTT